jgi:hypothetical protein
VKPPIALAVDRISRDTVEAKRKRLKGLAFAGIVVGPEGRACFTNATGEMYRSPIWARGVVAELHDALGELSRGRVPQGWEP